ncbi:hypothetical protein Tco_0087752 [Tanacetum coccineum]
MAAVNNVPRLVDKKGGSYAAIAPKVEPGKFNKWKKQMLCYLARMEPYYLKCIKDGPFQPKIVEGDDKHERYSDSKKALVTTSSSTAISTAFFSNNVIQDFQENFDDEADPKVQKDYKAEYKKIKAKLALLEANTSTSQTPKTFQPKNKGLVAETFDWDEEENHARNGEWIEITMRKVNILLSMDEDADSQNYLKYINIDLKFVEEKRLNLLSKYNKIIFELNKCRDELLVLKQDKLDAVTFQIQIQNTELTKLNHALQEKLKVEKKINEKWLTSSKKVSQCISDQIPHQKKKVLGGKMLTESSLKINENENLFVPASMGYYHEMVPKPKIGLKDSTLTADFQTLILEEF